MASRLFLLQLMGPVHGSSISGEAFKKYIVKNDDFVLPINLAKSGEDIGQFSLKKLLLVIKQILSVIGYSYKVDECVIFYTSNGLLFYRDLIFRYILRKKRVVLVMHNKGAYNSKVPNRFKRFFFSNTHIIVLAQELVSDFKKYSYNTVVSVVPNPLFEEVFYHDAKDYSTLRFLYLSNLIETKGVIKSIELVKRIISLGLDVSLDIVGKEVDVTHNQLEKSIGTYSNKIKYHGPKYGKEKLAFLQNSNILLFLSTYPKECLPLTIIEAMAYSMPVICINNGGVNSLISNRKNGLIIDSLENEEEMSDLASEILKYSTEEWSAMGIEALDRYNERHLLEIWKAKMLEIFK